VRRQRIVSGELNRLTATGVVLEQYATGESVASTHGIAFWIQHRRLGRAYLTQQADAPT